MKTLALPAATIVLFSTSLFAAQTPAPNPATPPADVTPQAAQSKAIPPPGNALTDADRAALQQELDALGTTVSTLRVSLQDKPNLKEKPDLIIALPDVEIYHKAVRYALEENTFYKPGDVQTAKKMLEMGRERAAQLGEGKTPWLEKPGLVVLGYRSRVDGSVQPYGLVIPPTFAPGGTKPRRLDFFLHGRGETLTELAFIDQRQKGAGEFTPPDTFVLHPYGRFCNANRFAGETDLFETLANVSQRFKVDGNRVVVRGFSMGGASCWQFATHYADRFAAAAPGAGFTNTPSYTGANKPGAAPLPWYEQKLWHLYDPTDYAVNLAQCPTVAYSGEIDKQKAAADNMATAMKAEGLELTHSIGPQTAHRYHPDSKKEINAFVDAAATKGRDTLPTRVRFTTWTLRYNKMDWVRVEGLQKHWERARVTANYMAQGNIGVVTAQTENVQSLAFDRADIGRVVLDGQTLPLSGRYVRETNGKWRAFRQSDNMGLHKQPGLEGPIDDAFYEGVVFVRPTGKPLTPASGAWVEAEMKRAIADWRHTMRGDMTVIDDTNVGGAAKNQHLVLWGDVQSNVYLKRIAAKLPVRWSGTEFVMNGKNYSVDRYAPVFVFPNTEDNSHYIVVNCGFTWAHWASASNAQHSPKLPDWAVLSTTLGPDLRAPGKVADAGFFDEQWQFATRPSVATYTVPPARQPIRRNYHAPQNRAYFNPTHIAKVYRPTTHRYVTAGIRPLNYRVLPRTRIVRLTTIPRMRVRRH